MVREEIEFKRSSKLCRFKVGVIVKKGRFTEDRKGKGRFTEDRKGKGWFKEDRKGKGWFREDRKGKG